MVIFQTRSTTWFGISLAQTCFPVPRVANEMYLTDATFLQHTEGVEVGVKI